jgi:hypothetical protein
MFKRICFFLFLLSIITCPSFGFQMDILTATGTSTPTATQTESTSFPPASNYTFPTAISAISVAAASMTITVSPGEIEDFGKYIPGESTGFTFDVYDSDILIGATSALASASSKWTGHLIASGTQGAKWDKETPGAFTLGICSNPGTATATIKLGVVYGRRQN